ncbi:MAG: site-specific DNA-methyltransferase, partial [Candidatus Marinimicrobia bacterium]|nr:site-specific DNA-methyltransferase [Candidatus Neomarinimicrobiota bacterium]
FTDPVYITSLSELYKNWNSRNIDHLFYAEQFNRVLKDNGHVALFSDFPTSVVIANALQKCFRFRFYWTWIKSNGQPVNSKQPISNVELISVWAKDKSLTRDLTFNPVMERGLPYRKKHRAGNRTRKMEKDYVTTSNGDRFPSQTLYFPSKDNLPVSERTEHPTQKSLGLCGYIIKTLSNEGNLILDPFSGTGSIPIAAFRLKRFFLGIEKDPEYYRESVKRLEVYQNQGELF